VLGIPRRRIRSFSPLRRKVGEGATVQSWLVETTVNLFCLLFLYLGLLDSSDGGNGESAGICGALAGRILLPLVEDSAWRYVLCFFQEMELWCFPMGSFLFRVDGFVIRCGFCSRRLGFRLAVDFLRSVRVVNRFTRERAMLGGRMEKPDDRWSRIADFLWFTCSRFLDLSER